MSLHVTFLGTGGAVPSVRRNTSALLLRREGDRLLFDCGEGTQRQMMRFGTGFDISHIFLTHMHGDHILGIPGLLQTLDFNDRTEGLAIHVPNGKRRAIRSLLRGSGTDPDFPVRVNEVGPGDVALERDDYEVRAFETDHRTLSVGYALVEDDRKGRFDRERAEELGVPVGPKFSELHEGNPVELEDGTVVQPGQVVGEPRPGRTVVYTGDTRPAETTEAVADDADLLVHDATFAEEHRDRAPETGHSTAAEAADLAGRAGARRLALVHISSRYAGRADVLAEEARAAFDGEVILPDDGDDFDVPYPDG
ncbi:MAG: ribonuclease Z [Haloglomus sp.]